MRDVCEGLRVVEFGSWMAGPLAAAVLTDHGADTIKVEPPGGDPGRGLPAFQTWNRGKKSVVLDLKSPEGRRSAAGLIRSADVVIVSYRPGVPERLGIGYPQVREINPRAVYAAITGFGEDGPYRDLKGYEALVAAKSGRMMIFERIADRPGPAFVALPSASFSAAMLAIQGIMAALHRRRQIGEGQKVDVSLFRALMPFDQSMWIRPQLEQHEVSEAREEKGIYYARQVHRPNFRVPRPNHLTAVTRDGVWLQFGNTVDHLCVAQMQALDLVHLYGEERFARLPAVFTEDDAEVLWEIVLERVRSRPYAEWRRILDEYKDVVVEELRWPLGAIQHRQVEHNQDIVEVPGLDGGMTLQPGPLVKRPSGARRSFGPAPAPGQHTVEVLGTADDQALGVAGAAATAEPDAAGPLAGITMLDFTAFLAGPFAGTVLANMGARVIKVEPLGGDPSRYMVGGLLPFTTTPGKHSIAVDVKRPEGRQIVHDLIRKADLLLHNYRPGVPERLGIDYETCRRLNSRIVYVNAFAYGAGGPDRDRPAFYTTAGAIAGNTLRQVGGGRGMLDVDGLDLDAIKHKAWRIARATEGNPDIHGALAAATALMLGLHARDATGEGVELETTLVRSNLWANSDELIAYDSRPEPRMADAGLYGLGPLYRLYRAAEGWVFLACVRRDEWEAFCEAVGRRDLRTCWEGAWDVEARAQGLAAELQGVFEARSAAEWEGLLAPAGVPLVAVATRDPGRVLLEEGVIRETHMARVESQEYGSYLRQGALQTFSLDGQTLGSVEPVGGHTRDILLELGRRPEEVDRLVQEGIVEVP